jgi:pimeloyl-ACP methyl ester carboxylesterase
VGRGALRQAPRDHAACLVVNGVRDMMIPVWNSYALTEHIPNAMLLVYPDAGHGSLFQYHDSFVQQARLFLDP